MASMSKGKEYLKISNQGRRQEWGVSEGVEDVEGLKGEVEEAAVRLYQKKFEPNCLREP